MREISLCDKFFCIVPKISTVTLLSSEKEQKGIDSIFKRNTYVLCYVVE